MFVAPPDDSDEELDLSSEDPADDLFVLDSSNPGRHPRLHNNKRDAIKAVLPLRNLVPCTVPIVDVMPTFGDLCPIRKINIKWPKSDTSDLDKTILEKYFSSTENFLSSSVE